MRLARQGSGWFRALFVVVMLLACAALAFFAVEQVRLKAQIDDLTLSLETSRGREARQNHEYDGAVSALPDVKAELERVAPLAEAAKAEEAALRQQRKEMRAEIAALEEQIDAAQTELDALMEQARALQQAVDGLGSILATPKP